MEKEKEYLENLKLRIIDTSNLSFIQQDFHRASSLSHIIGRIELVQEAIESYEASYL